MQWPMILRIISPVVGFVSLLFLSAPNLLAADPYLANWMGELTPIIGGNSLLNLTLPGSHDSLTFDLGTIVSDGGDDDSEPLSELLHLLSEAGLADGGWIRTQAQAQTLTL